MEIRPIAKNCQSELKILPNVNRTKVLEITKDVKYFAKAAKFRKIW